MKILVFPDDKNPYQKLLYFQMKKYGINVTFLKNTYGSNVNWLFLGIFLQLFLYRSKGFKIFHLHWLYPFSIRIMNNYTNRIIISIYVPILLIYLKILGYKTVWTIHNLVPHETQFINDLLLGGIISRLVDAKIVHSKNNILLMKTNNFSIKNTYIIPIGNYIGHYPNRVTKRIARNKLKLKHSNIILLFFGQIRLYKGILELLKSIFPIIKTNKKISFVIAGKCEDKELKKTLLKAKTINDQIILNFKHIPKNKVQYYFNSSDCVLLPFNKVTTSSSAVLAFSFKKAIIAPRIGNIIDFPKYTGIYYNQENKEGLKRSIMKGIQNKNKLHEYGENAYSYVKSFSWNKSALKTLEIYKSLI